MSIRSEITRISTNVSNAFSAIKEKGGTVSSTSSDNLEAAIRTIPTMGAVTSGLYALHIDAAGCLILEYDTTEQPPFSLDANGNLILTYEGSAPPLSINDGGELIYTIGG